MAAHIPTKQIIKHFKTVDSFSVDGSKKEHDFAITDEYLKIGDHTFPFDYFDIAGVTIDHFHLADSSRNYHKVTCYDIEGKHLEHPEWTTEPYDTERVRNGF